MNGRARTSIAEGLREEAAELIQGEHDVKRFARIPHF